MKTANASGIKTANKIIRANNWLKKDERISNE